MRASGVFEHQVAASREELRVQVRDFERGVRPIGD